MEVIMLIKGMQVVQLLSYWVIQFISCRRLWLRLQAVCDSQSLRSKASEAADAEALAAKGEALW